MLKFASDEEQFITEIGSICLQKINEQLIAGDVIEMPIEAGGRLINVIRFLGKNYALPNFGCTGLIYLVTIGMIDGIHPTNSLWSGLMNTYDSFATSVDWETSIIRSIPLRVPHMSDLISDFRVEAFDEDISLTYDIEITYMNTQICKKDLVSGEYQTIWLNHLCSLDNATIIVNTEYAGNLLIIFGAVCMLPEDRGTLINEGPFLVNKCDIITNY